MAHVSGLSGVAYARVPGAQQVPGNPAAAFDASNAISVIDGTPVRIAVIALAAAAGLTILKLSGFRFNVGVSA